jgi:hypothetical protein
VNAGRLFNITKDYTMKRKLKYAREITPLANAKDLTVRLWHDPGTGMMGPIGEWAIEARDPSGKIVFGMIADKSYCYAHALRHGVPNTQVEFCGTSKEWRAKQKAVKA